MANFWKVVNQVIEDSDIIIEVVDSRLIEETRNLEIENKVLDSGKKLLIVVNKSDLVSKKYLDIIKKDYKNIVFVSAKEKLGTTLLRKAIMRLSKAKSKEKIVVGVLGYPNTGKSSVINALKGRHSAKASPFAGYTKGKQFVKISEKVLLVDTPGVIPFKEEDEVKHAIISSVNPDKIKDPESVGERIIGFIGDKGLSKVYGDVIGKNPEETLEKIAVRLGKIKKGGIPDTETGARILIKDWQRGKLFVED